MKVTTYTLIRTLDDEKVHVTVNWRGEIMVEFGTNAFHFSPKNAVKVWRFLTGQSDGGEVEYVRHGIVDKTGSVIESYSENGKPPEWRLQFTDDYIAVLDEDDAMALAWAIESAVANALNGAYDAAGGRQVKQYNPEYVWVLACRRILTADFAGEGCEQIGGHEQVFLSEESAREGLREFMRPLVNEAHEESHWDAVGRNVDDILDGIASSEQKHGECCYRWSYYGTKQSFEVTLCKRMVLK